MDPAPIPLAPTEVSQFQAGPVFMVCLCAAIGLLYLFARKKFNERNGTDKDDYVYQLLPSELATRQEYNKGFLTYLGAMVFVVLVFSLLGAKDLEFFGISLKGVSTNVVPLAISVLLVGVVPNVPVLQEIERRLRQYAQEIAYIPQAALATAETLSTAKFDFSQYAGDALDSEEMRGIDAKDFEQPRHTLEYSWARLGCLVYEQKSVLESGAADAIDTGLLRAYRKDLGAIERDKKSMEPEIELYRAERAKNPRYSNKDLHDAIRNDLYKLYILLGCAVRLKRSKDINLALAQFGFRLGEAKVQNTNGDLKLVMFAVIAGSILILDFAAALLSQFGFWQPSALFPARFDQLEIEFVWTSIPFVVAIIVADFMRQYAIKNNSWFEANGPASAANYIRVAFCSGIAAYAALTAWGAIFAWPTIQGLKSDIFYSLIAMVTGGFYLWHLDNAELHRRPAGWTAAGVQALLTGLSGIIAAVSAWSILLDGSPAPFKDKIILVGIVGAVMGGVLGWFTPKVAAAAKPDPLAQAIKQRESNLEAVAIKRLGEDAGKQWLDSPHAALGRKTPRAAAADVNGFEQAFALLQAPQAMAG